MKNDHPTFEQLCHAVLEGSASEAELEKFRERGCTAMQPTERPTTSKRRSTPYSFGKTGAPPCRNRSS